MTEAKADKERAESITYAELKARYGDDNIDEVMKMLIEGYREKHKKGGILYDLKEVEK